MTGQRKPVIGLVLGSGSARGWAHIGVIRALQQAGYDIAGRIADFTITQIDGGASA